MKKTFLLGLLLIATSFMFGQGNTLYRVNVVKPKVGMKSSFETSWKSHMAKLHNTTDKRLVR